MNKPVAFAIAAHPDDIEFLMAGTLLLLKSVGFELHYMNLSSGNCGSNSMPASKVRRVRLAESREAARILGATHHGSIADDLEIFYEPKSLRRLAAVVREVKPTVVLTHSPQDYMEDHMNTCRLAVTAAFARGMPNFATLPKSAAVEGDVTVYHAMPHGLRDGLGQPVAAEFYVDVGAVLETKRHALAAHASQKEWLDVSQGMDSYLAAMEQMSAEVGRMSRKFRVAEGWRRHSHLGFCATDADPIRRSLPAALIRNAGTRRAAVNAR